MSQLQLYISKTYKGFKSIVNVNPTEEIARHIHDFSGALEIVRYEASLAPKFFLLTFIKGGLLLSCLRPISGEEHDHYAATLFIPAGVSIAPDEFHVILDAAWAVIAPGRDPDADALAPIRALLARDYPTSGSDHVHEVSHGKNYAFARYGTSDAPTFNDYLAEGFYQPEFVDYAGVLLFHGDRGALGLTHAADLTRKKPAHMVPLLPPARTDTGFVPTIDREPFDKPIMVEQGSTVIINWRHGGFEPTVQEFTVSAPGMIPPQPDTRQARRVITPSTFIITEQSSHQAVSQYEITINGRHITGPEVFSYSELLAANVHISAPGYFAFTGTLDLASNTQAMIHLRHLDNIYRFDLPLNTPEPAEALRLYIKSKQPIKNSPVEGYEVADGSIEEGASQVNRLIYKGRTRAASLIIAAAALVVGLAIGFLAGWFIFHGATTSYPDIHETQATETVPPATAEPALLTDESTATTSPAAEQADIVGTPTDESVPMEEPQSIIIDESNVANTAAPAAAPDYDAAAEYMQNNKTWTREALEAIPGMAGFFDDLNTYNFKRITTYWKPLLGGKSSTFDTVVRACEGAASKRDPHLAPHDPFYSSDDGKINWRAYTYWVDP